MNYSYLNEMMLMLIATVSIIVLFLRMNIPPILGYLTVGIIIGPYGTSLIYDVEHIRTFAEFGVVFLLFSIGLELSTSLLIRMKASVLGLGSAQVLLTTTLITAIAVMMGRTLESATIIGGIIAMSSTALVTKQLADQAELHTRHGRNSLGILLFQDLMVVPLLILVAMIGGHTRELSPLTIINALLQGSAALLFIFAFGRWVLKPLFREVSRFHSAELFTLTVLLTVLCSAWITYKIGLTFALGAFLAGMMLSETEFKHQVESEVRPFRDVLLGLFFITVGMMLNLTILPNIWLPALLLFFVLVLFKFALITIFCRIGGWNSAVATRTGLILAHGGEFGFAVLILAINQHVLSQHDGQVILTAMLFSMALAPLLIRHNANITARLLPKSMKKSRQTIQQQISQRTQGLNHHIIVCGYGRIGRYALTALQKKGLPCMAIDLDPEQVRTGRAQKQPVFYGDAGSLELLHACGLQRASALVISMIDFNTAMKIITRVRSLHTSIPIYVRTRKEIHLYQLYQAGASEVIADTFGSDQMLHHDILQQLARKLSNDDNK